MATVCKAYSTPEAARHAAAALEQAGIAAHDIGLLVGLEEHDVREEPIGNFAGSVGPEAPVGKYAGPPRARWQAAGGFAGRPDRQRQGSYGDIGGAMSVVNEDDGEHAHLTGDLLARRRLAHAHVPDDVAHRMVHELHHGRVVMFAEVSDEDLGTAETALATEPPGHA